MIANNLLLTVFAKLFTKPCGFGEVRTIKLAPDEPVCVSLSGMGLVEWWPGPGGWVFTDLGNALLNSISEGNDVEVRDYETTIAVSQIRDLAKARQEQAIQATKDEPYEARFKNALYWQSIGLEDAAEILEGFKG